MSIKQNVARAKTDYDEVYNAGKKAEYDAFWDIYQNYGNRSVFIRAFAGYGFSFDNFYPKYDIRPTDSADTIFYFWDGRGGSNHNGSLIDRLNECGVVLDTSQCISMTQAFTYSRFTEIPTVDFTALTRACSQIFYDSRALKKIEKIIVRDNTTYNNWFTYAKFLEEIRVEGVIGNDINFQDCPLTVESMIDIITHLKKYIETDTEDAWTRTIYFNDDCWARLEASGISTPNGDPSWKGYVNDALKWNI